jgi:Ran GTPase-activating protein (RanGAP) involved in mRNA processing and transport
VLNSLDVGDVGNNKLDEEAALGIVRAARQHDRLTNLGLAYCKIGPTGAKEIADYILFSSVLTECCVRGNHLDVASATALATIAKEKRVMLFGIKHDQTEADFSGERLGPADAILIASDLSISGALKQCSLSGNNIKDEGAIAIGECLKTNNTLEGLDLSRCGIGAEGAKAIAQSGMGVLKKCSLSYNEIQDEGATALGECLKVNQTLEELELVDCGIGTEGAKAISAALSEGSRVLKKLDLRLNSVACG